MRNCRPIGSARRAPSGGRRRGDVTALKWSRKKWSGSLLVQRIFEPTVGSTLYHYCSATAFEAIVRSGKIRFSDINMMTDAHEMQWGYRVFECAASELIKLSRTKTAVAGFTKDYVEKIDKIVSSLQLHMHQFISSFSREPDLLAQWREYADNAHGFSVGFDAQALQNMPATLLSVEYDQSRQIEEMKDALGAIYLENRDDGNRFGPKFRQSCRLLGNLMSGFKNLTFEVEKEVRLLHALTVHIRGRSMRLIDVGGFIGKTNKVKGEPVQFRVLNNAIVAFVDIPFGRGFLSYPIRGVILGSKNPNKQGNVVYFLNDAGYENVTIRKSACSDR